MANKTKFEFVYLSIILLASMMIFPIFLRAEHPGETIFDPEDDVSIAHVDVIKLESILDGETLSVIFFLKDVPSELTFNRFGVPENYKEYDWSVYVDVNNNQETDYSIAAMNFVFEPNAPVTKPISDGVQVNTWIHDESGGASYLASASIYVDDQLNTIKLTGDIPGITSESNLSFLTFDYNPEGYPIMDFSGDLPPLPDVTIDMNIPAGWSMISLPIKSDNPVVSNLFPEAVVVYTYEKGTGYVRIKNEENLEEGKGYWILLKEEKIYTLKGPPIMYHTLTINKDSWAMIGGCIGPAQPFVDNCNISVIYGYEQGSGYQQILASEKLDPCKGYWILLEGVLDHCELIVELTDPNSP